MTATTAPTPVSAALAGLLDCARPASSLAASQPLSAPTFPRWKGPAGHLSNTTLAALVALLTVLAALVAPGLASGLTGSPAEHASGVAAASAEALPGLHGPAGETRVRASNLADGTRVGVNSAESATLHPGSDGLYDQTASGWLVAPRSTALGDEFWRATNVGPNRAGTLVPESFDLAVGGQKFSVHPNATKHMAEYATSHQISHVPMSSFAGSVESALGQGLRPGRNFLQVGPWELGIDTRSNVIYHAVYRPG